MTVGKNVGPHGNLHTGRLHHREELTQTTQLFVTLISYRQSENETSAGQCVVKFTESQQCPVKAILV